MFDTLGLDCGPFFFFLWLRWVSGLDVCVLQRRTAGPEKLPKPHRPFENRNWDLYSATLFHFTSSPLIIKSAVLTNALYLRHLEKSMGVGGKKRNFYYFFLKYLAFFHFITLHIVLLT